MKEYFVDNDQQLEILCKALSMQSVIALDTEFLREKTYFAKLCLVQVACRDFVGCVDPLAFENLQPLLDVIYDSKIIKVMHSARQDLEIFYDITSELPANMFDTQITATLLGFGDQVGYANLVKSMLGVKLAKLHTRTDWSKRPLDKGQVQYALDDVRYLLEIHQQQQHQLEKLGREHWLDNEFSYLTNKQHYVSVAGIHWQKIRGNNTLKGVQLAILQNLAEWRDNYARNMNRPRQWIIKDDILIELARRQPANEQAMENIRGWDNNNTKLTAQILELIQNARQIPSTEWPKVPKYKSLTKEQETIVDVLMIVIKIIATQNAVSPSIVLNRRQVEKLVVGEDDEPVLEGWRKNLIGNEINAMLNGCSQLRINNGQAALQPL